MPRTKLGAQARYKGPRFGSGWRPRFCGLWESQMWMMVKSFIAGQQLKSEFSLCRVKPLRCLKNTLLWNKFPSHFLSKHICIILNWNDKCWLSIGTSWLLLSLMWWPERHCPAMGTPCLQCNQEASRSELTNDTDFTSGCSDFEVKLQQPLTRFIWTQLDSFLTP